MEWRGREGSGGEGRGGEGKGRAGQGRAGQGARLLRWTFTGSLYNMHAKCIISTWKRNSTLSKSLQHINI